MLLIRDSSSLCVTNKPRKEFRKIIECYNPISNTWELVHCKKQTLNSPYVLLISKSLMWYDAFYVRPHGNKSWKRQMHCCMYVVHWTRVLCLSSSRPAADIDHFMHYIVYGLEFTVQTWRKETGKIKILYFRYIRSLNSSKYAVCHKNETLFHLA
jgi:hypothetical protein